MIPKGYTLKVPIEKCSDPSGPKYRNMCLILAIDTFYSAFRSNTHRVLIPKQH